MIFVGDIYVNWIVFLKIKLVYLCYCFGEVLVKFLGFCINFKWFVFFSVKFVIYYIVGF